MKRATTVVGGLALRLLSLDPTSAWGGDASERTRIRVEHRFWGSEGEPARAFLGRSTQLSLRHPAEHIRLVDPHSAEGKRIGQNRNYPTQAVRHSFGQFLEISFNLGLARYFNRI